MLGSLRDLLASPRSADELQEELVNMFGFEDGSFELIAEILASREVRGDVARALKSSSSSKANATIASGRQTPGGGPSHGSFTPNGVAAAASANHHHLNGLNGAAAGPIGYSPSEIAARIQAQLDAASSRPLFSSDGPSHAGRQEQYPHVYTSASSAGVTAASSYGGRLALPLGTIRKEDDVSLIRNGDLGQGCCLAHLHSLSLFRPARFRSPVDQRRSRHPTCHTRPTQRLGTPDSRRRTRTTRRWLFPRLYDAQSSPIDRSAVRDGNVGEHARVRADWCG